MPPDTISQSQTSACPFCGGTIPADSPGGWCPACLMRNLLDGDLDQDEAEPASLLDARDKIGPNQMLEESGAGVTTIRTPSSGDP
ncbi:MAG: hypothetical protein WCS43_10215 [Verrucomicrobiota bacterium]